MTAINDGIVLCNLLEFMEFGPLFYCFNTKNDLVKIGLGESTINYSYLTLILYTCTETADPDIICSP